MVRYYDIVGYNQSIVLSDLPYLLAVTRSYVVKSLQLDEITVYYHISLYKQRHCLAVENESLPT